MAAAPSTADCTTTDKQLDLLLISSHQLAYMSAGWDWHASHGIIMLMQLQA